MRRIAAILCSLCLLSLPCCRFAQNVFRDEVFGGLAEAGDTSRPPSERREAYDKYIRENVDK